MLRSISVDDVSIFHNIYYVESSANQSAEQKEESHQRKIIATSLSGSKVLYNDNDNKDNENKSKEAKD